MKFKPGSRVRLITDRYGDTAYNPVWDKPDRIWGTVKEVYIYGSEKEAMLNDDYCMTVVWDNGRPNNYRYNDLETDKIDKIKAIIE